MADQAFDKKRIPEKKTEADSSAVEKVLHKYLKLPPSNNLDKSNMKAGSYPNSRLGQARVHDGFDIPWAKKAVPGDSSDTLNSATLPKFGGDLAGAASGIVARSRVSDAVAGAAVGVDGGDAAGKAVMPKRNWMKETLRGLLDAVTVHPGGVD